MNWQLKELRDYAGTGENTPEFEALKKKLSYMEAELKGVDEIAFFNPEGSAITYVDIDRHNFERRLYVRQKDAGIFVIADVQRQYAMDDMSGEPSRVTVEKTEFEYEVELLRYLANLLAEEIYSARIAGRAHQLVAAAMTGGVLSRKSENPEN